uniref:Uncharacterized protein n=1 Tax=Theropithecus gelada TaxID=9565 RepID=A0A8D2K4X6_THEGE
FPLSGPGSCPGSHFQWCFSQVDGAIEEDMTEDPPRGRADIISTVEFNYSGAPVAGDEEGRVIFHRARWRAPAVPATREAEAGEWREPGRRSLQ